MFHFKASEVKPMTPSTVYGRADVSLDDFIQWLETFDPRDHYFYFAFGGQCLMGQYMNARGIPWGTGLYGPTCIKVLGVEGERDVLAIGTKTIGAALKRAKALREHQNAA
jgi:hypothetical protein